MRVLKIFSYGVAGRILRFLYADGLPNKVYSIETYFDFGKNDKILKHQHFDLIIMMTDFSIVRKGVTYMTRLSSILFDALRSVIDDMLDYAKELGENYGEIAVDVRDLPPEPTKARTHSFEFTYCAAVSRVEEGRHKFLTEYVRSAHTDSLSGKTHAKMGWHGSDAAFERQVLCYEDCDYSIAVGVLFRNSEHNAEIAAETIKRIEMLQCK